MRRLLLLLLALPILLIGGHYLLWRWAEQQMAAQTADWIAAQRAAGWIIRAGPGEGGGWPYAATLVLPDVAIAGGEAWLPGGLAWRADRVRLRVALFHPRALTIGLEGLQTLRLGALPELHFAADDMTILAPLDPGIPTRTAALSALHLRAGLPDEGAGGITVADLHAHADTRPGTTQGEPALSLTLLATGIGLPAGFALARDGALGPTIARVSLDAAIDGPVPAAHDLPTRLAQWRDGGGTLPIQSLSVDWGPMSFSGSATLALDEQLQPMGAATTRVAGWSAAVDALVRTGMLPARTALAAKAVLSLLARTPEGGGPEEVEVPLTVQDRTLSFGRIPLAKLPAVTWPP